VESIELRVSERSNNGSSNARRSRKEGMLPAVVYHPGDASVSLLLDRKEFMLSARGKAPTQIFKFVSDDSLNETLSLVKSVQLEPLKGEILHVEFLALRDGHKVVVDVPVKVSGVPECVRLNTAMINQTAYEIALLCDPGAIPSDIVIDISHLKAGESLTAGDISLPEGTLLKSRTGMTIVSALIDRRALAQSTSESAEAA
jgi:large subunit ribosomal protein L25